MTQKVTLQQVDHLPMPLICLASPEDLAQWSVSQLAWDLGHGQRHLTLSCFDTTSMGFPIEKAVPAVLKAVMDFLYGHPEVERLTILCAGHAVYRAYSLHWNIWYAPCKPQHDHGGSL